MPTENRSSNTEMVSVPEGFMLVERSIWTEQQVEAATACITRLKGVPGMRDCDLAMAAIDAAQCKAPEISLADLLPAQQHQAEPVAWVRFRNGEPDYDGDAVMISNVRGDTLGDGDSWEPVYTHADPAEVERLRRHLQAARVALASRARTFDTLRADLETMRRKNNEYWHESEAMRAQLDERDHQLGLIGTCLGEILVAAKHIRAGVGLTGPQLLQFGEELRDCLSASAEPSAPACLTCKGSGLEYDSGAAHPCTDCKSGAPVEIDELIAELAGLEINGDKPSAEVPDDHDEFLDANASAALWLLLNVGRIRAALARKP